jgi:uncharacterized membrane protein YdjX (TVP38/TMEM64 family)
VFTLRLIFWMPPLLHAFFGVSRVPFRTHFWGSLAGYVLPLLGMAYFGQGLFDAARRARPAAWGALAALAAAAATLFLLARRARRRRPSLRARDGGRHAPR